MAEAMLRGMGGEDFEAFSAGTEASAVRPEAIAVMAEVGIDISGQQSKTLDGFVRQPFDWVITVCDNARETCPVFPGVEQTAHWGVDDPGDVIGSEARRLEAFRQARDDLRNRVRLFITTASRPAVTHPVETLRA
jgi:arsenate reductase